MLPSLYQSTQVVISSWFVSSASYSITYSCAGWRRKRCHRSIWWHRTQVGTWGNLTKCVLAPALKISWKSTTLVIWRSEQKRNTKYNRYVLLILKFCLNAFTTVNIHLFHLCLPYSIFGRQKRLLLLLYSTVFFPEFLYNKNASKWSWKHKEMKMSFQCSRSGFNNSFFRRCLSYVLCLRTSSHKSSITHKSFTLQLTLLYTKLHNPWWAQVLNLQVKCKTTRRWS